MPPPAPLPTLQSIQQFMQGLTRSTASTTSTTSTTSTAVTTGTGTHTVSGRPRHSRPHHHTSRQGRQQTPQTQPSLPQNQPTFGGYPITTYRMPQPGYPNLNGYQLTMHTVGQTQSTTLPTQSPTIPTQQVAPTLSHHVPILGTVNAPTHPDPNAEESAAEWIDDSGDEFTNEDN